MKRSLAAHLQPLRLAPEGHLDRVEDAVEALVGLHPALPVARERADRVDGHDPHAGAALGQPPRQVELGDVAAEEVRQVDRGDQQVHPLRRVVGHEQLERRDLLGHRARPRALGAAPPGPRRQVRRRHRVQAQAPPGPRAAPGRQRHQPAPQEREEDARPRRPASAAVPVSSRAAARGEPAERRGRRVRRRERAQRAPLGGGHPVAAAHLEHGRELAQAAVVHEEVHPPAPHPLARVLAELGHPVAHRGPAVRGGVAEHGGVVLGVVVEGAVHELDLAERQGGERDPVVVEVRELRGREGQRVVEQVAPHQRRRAGHRVRHQQRGDVVVVVAAAAPSRCRPAARRRGRPAGRRCRPAGREPIAPSRVSSLSGSQRSSWSAMATNSASAGAIDRARSKLRVEAEPARASATPMKRGSPASSASISAKRAGLEQSSLTRQTQFSCVWARIDST